MHIFLWCLLSTLWVDGSFGLTCQYGSTFPSAGAQSGVFTDEDCGVGNYVCEYRESVQESGYGSQCTSHGFCEDDMNVRTYEWKNVKCCNDSNDCSTSGIGATSGSTGASEPILGIFVFALLIPALEFLYDKDH